MFSVNGQGSNQLLGCPSDHRKVLKWRQQTMHEYSLVREINHECDELSNWDQTYTGLSHDHWHSQYVPAS